MMKKITVIFVLYHAERRVGDLIRAIEGQKHPKFQNQSDWLDVIFIDDHSKDETVPILKRGLEKIGSPPHYQVVVNPSNLGLSANLNKAFAMVTTPYALTCHYDCLFGREDYVAGMANLMDRFPNAGAITGQPKLPSLGETRDLPFAEKLNLITNLMDIFPPDSRDLNDSKQELLPTGFAEGRCDCFRMEALRTVGFYDTTLKFAGEDQILAARLRAEGFEIYLAPQFPYLLSVSDEQDTVWKLVRHQRLFGRAHPYILLKTRGTSEGVLGNRAGHNRQSRTILRLAQLVSVIIYLEVGVGVLRGQIVSNILLVVFWTLLLKTPLFLRHLLAIRLTPVEYIKFYLLQPVLDISYSIGITQGLIHLARGTESRPIG